MSRAELKQVFETSKSTDEMLQAFKKMEENGSSEMELGMECLRLTYDFHEQGHHPEKILCLGKKGLKSLIILVKNSSKNSNFTLLLARLLYLLGSVCHQLNRFSESISYLNWAVRNLLTKLEAEKDSSSPNPSPSPSHIGNNMLCDVYLELFRVKKAIGRKDEAFGHLRKCLEFKEMNGMVKGSPEIGKAYHELADWCLEVQNFEEAVSFYLKAEEIFMEHFRPDSLVLMKVRRELALIYTTQLEEHEKALELNQLNLSVLRSKGCGYDLVEAELFSACVLTAMDRCDEAVEVLKAVVSRAEMVGDDRGRARAFTLMAKARCKQEKFSEAKKYIRIALRIIEKKDIDSNNVVITLNEMSSCYQLMEEYESAVSLSRRVLATPDIPECVLINCSEKLVQIMNLTGSEKHRMCFEDAVERLKEHFGPYHVQVGYGYIYLGASYFGSGKSDIAAKYLVLAKSVMDVSLSPDQPDSVEMSQCLSALYTTMGSYSLAIECQEKVVKVLEGIGPSQKDFLDNAVELLNDIKKEASGDGDVSQE